ncbi:MAG: hypothetical protein NVSMB54_13570 [Ktedonobacteraceae bacterium]
MKSEVYMLVDKFHYVFLLLILGTNGRAHGARPFVPTPTQLRVFQQY